MTEKMFSCYENDPTCHQTQVDDITGRFLNAFRRSARGEVSPEPQHEYPQFFVKKSAFEMPKRIFRTANPLYDNYAGEAYRNDMQKLADIAGGPNSSEFEQSFAQIAESYISSKAPLLTRYLLGFQLLKKTDDDTRACGIFAYKLGEELVYIPVFFIDGELRGHEMMYIVSRDQFRPSDEKQVNDLLSRRPIEPGSVETRDRSEIHAPASMTASRMPSEMKLSSYDGNIPQLHQELVLDALRRMFKSASQDDPMKRFRQMSGMFSPSRLFDESYRATKLASAWSQKYPAIGRMFQNIGVADALDHALTRWEKRAELAERLGVTQQTGLQRLRSLFHKKASAASKPIVRVYQVNEIPIPTYRLLKQATIEQIHRDGCFIIDDRNQTKLASVIESPKAVNSETMLRNPDGPGKYSVFLADGTFRDMIVLNDVDPVDFNCPRNPADNEDIKYLLVDPKTESLVSSTGNGIWTNKKYPDTDFVKDLPAGKPFMKAPTNGEKPVKYDYDFSNRHRCLLVTSNGNAWDNDFFQISDRIYSTRWGRTTVSLILENDNAGFQTSGVDTPGNTHLVVGPKNAKCCCLKYDEDAKDYPRLGSDNLWLTLLVSNTLPISVQKTEDEYYSVDDEMPKKEASVLETLMVKHHLSADNAKELLKRADVNVGQFGVYKPVHVYRTRVTAADNELYEKIATGDGNVPIDPLRITFPEKGHGYNNVNDTSVEDDVETEEAAGALTPTNPTDPYRNERGLAKTDGSLTAPDPNPRDMELAQRASQMGQQEFVSAQMLMSLLREIDSDDLIHKYITVIEKAMDAYARIRMQLLWRTDAFEERFGKSQLKELDEMLVNLFQQTGDFACYLRQRDVRPAPVLSLGSSSIDVQE